MDAPITQLLSSWRDGDSDARDQLVATLYPELRRIAQGLFRNERANHTLQPTALVNEAWLRLSGSDSIPVEDRGHLLAIAARLMREILIDHARRRDAAKRDGGERITLSGLDVADGSGAIDLVGLDGALNRLERIDPVKARIVELRYFGGLSIEETGVATEQSPATVKRHWQAARIWLFNALDDGRLDGQTPSRRSRHRSAHVQCPHPRLRTLHLSANVSAHAGMTSGLATQVAVRASDYLQSTHAEGLAQCLLLLVCNADCRREP